MEYYFYLILLITFISLLGSFNSNKHKGNLQAVIISFSLIILFQSIRKWTVGVDVVTYINFFNKLSSESLSDFSSVYSSIETGFLVYNKLISLITSDIQVFLGIISATIFIPLGYVLYKNSRNLYLSIIALITLGIYNFTFSGIRQSIAIAIAFFSFEFIKKKKIWRFVLFVILASSFHSSALVFLPAYPLYHVKIKKKHFAWILLLISIIFIFKSFLLRFIVTSVFEKYDNSDLLVETGAYTMFFIMFFIYTLSVLSQRKKEFSIPLNAYSNFMLVALIIQIAASESQIAMRAGYYYFIFITLLLPEMISVFNIKKERNLIVFLTLTFCLLFYFYTTNSSALNPYHFYWE